MHELNKFTITIDLGIALARLVADDACRKAKLTLELSGPVTLRELIERLGIPGEYIGFITVNGERKEADTRLGPGDQVIFIPYITGG